MGLTIMSKMLFNARNVSAAPRWNGWVRGWLGTEFTIQTGNRVASRQVACGQHNLLRG